MDENIFKNQKTSELWLKPFILMQLLACHKKQNCIGFDVIYLALSQMAQEMQ